MPLGLLSLAAVTLQHSISTRIYEPKIRLLQKKDYVIVARDILQTHPDVVGFSTWCTSYPGVILLAHALKKLDPKLIVVFGGPQASILPEMTLMNYSFVDFVLTGEADQTFTNLLLEIGKNKPDFTSISGLYYRNASGKPVKALYQGELKSDLDNLPMPAYELVPKQKTIKLDAGRGCPFQCTYCTTNHFFSKHFRMKSTERIIDEMLELNKKFRVTDFEFSHDMFTLRKQEILRLCEKLCEIRDQKGISFTWKCSARIDCIDREMIDAMHRAGCVSIFFGIESGSVRMQKVIRKNLQPEQAAAIADTCREIGIDMHASYMLGFPQETKQELNLTLLNLMQLLLKGALVQSSILSLLPGTPLYNTYHQYLKFDGNFSNFSQTVCNREELALIRKSPEIFSSFYYLPVRTISRPALVFLGHLINKLPQFRNTFYLLENKLSRDFSNTDLLKAFKKEYAKISNGKPDTPVELILIRYLESYLSREDVADEMPFLKDIFQYEAYAALLKNLYLHWQLLDHSNDPTIQIHSRIIVNPVWKHIETRYKLEYVLPTENGWQKRKTRLRKGKYNYLMVASSEISCQRVRLSAKETKLLSRISADSVGNYIRKVSDLVKQEEAISWLKKLTRLGVIQCSAT